MAPSISVEDPDNARRQRLLLIVTAALLLLLGALLPHVGIRDGAPFGRSLIPAGMYFVGVQAGAFGDLVNVSLLAFGFNTAYLGLASHQFGFVLGLGSFWILYAVDINRWIWRILVGAGWMLTLSAPLVIVGRILIGAAGVPATLGLAWLPALLSGLILVIGAYRSKDRIDRSWYVARPELL